MIATIESLLRDALGAATGGEARVAEAMEPSADLGRVFRRRAAARDRAVALDPVARAFGELPRRRESPGVRGILGEGEALLGSRIDPAVRDAGPLAVGRRLALHELGLQESFLAWVDSIALDGVAETFERARASSRAFERTLADLERRIVVDRAIHV